MAVAIFAATALARALGGTRIVIAQAAVGAILTVAVADAEAGIERLTDALIGVGRCACVQSGHVGQRRPWRCSAGRRRPCSSALPAGWR